MERVRLVTRNTPEMLTLLFKLSLAAALPPDAIMAPRNPEGPAIYPEQHTIFGVDAVEAIIRRPIIAAGSGRVVLREVDQRLNGLVVRLDAFRVADTPVALVSIGVVSADPASSAWPRTTTRELWTLANEALVKHGVPCEHLVGIGDDAFLALHGGRTAQVAWLTGDRLATVSVTSLSGDRHWAMAAARSIAQFADEHLASDDGERPASRDR